MMSPDYSKRGYLLPKGCKDLIDLIHLQQSEKRRLAAGSPYISKLPLMVQWQAGQPSSELPPITAEILISEGTSVGELAALLGQKPFKIIADLMDLGIFASLTQLVGFGAMRKVARKYGYAARRPA